MIFSEHIYFKTVSTLYHNATNHFPIISLARSLNFLVSLSNRVCIIKKRKTYESLVTKNGGKKYHSKYYIIATSKILETTLQHQRKRSIFPKFFKLKTQTKLLKSIFEEGNPVHRDTIAPRYIFNGYIFR